MTPNPPRVDPALVPALRADLVASRYTVAGVTELLGPMAHRRPRPRPGAARPAGHGRLDRAGRHPGAAVRPRRPRRRRRGGRRAAHPRRRRRRRARPGRSPRVTPSSPCATCARTPPTASTGGWPPTSVRWRPGRPLREDHVLGIGGASTTLASWTPRPHVDRALDLGTGCGVQALHLEGARRRGGGHRPVRAGPGVRAVQRRPRRGRLGRARRLDARPGGGGAVRAGRQQPAVRHHPPVGGRAAVRVPRRRRRRGCRRA